MAIPLTALRIYFATVGIFAIWVGVWGYFCPAVVDNALPWLVPPLHARFLGSMYLSGAVLMFGAMRARSLDRMWISVLMATIWTGMLGLVSFLHLDQFEWWRSTVWFWFFAYVTFPVTGAILAFRIRNLRTATGRPVARWTRALAIAQAIVCIVLAGFLFFAPDAMAGVWPWKITPLLAQIYSGPFLSYGIGSALVGRAATGDAVRLPLLSMAAFALLVLVASLMHFGLFVPIATAGTLWFAGLAAAALFALAALTVLYRKPTA